MKQTALSSTENRPRRKQGGGSTIQRVQSIDSTTDYGLDGTDIYNTKTGKTEGDIRFSDVLDKVLKEGGKSEFLEQQKNKKD